MKNTRPPLEISKNFYEGILHVNDNQSLNYWLLKNKFKNFSFHHEFGHFYHKYWKFSKPGVPLTNLLRPPRGTRPPGWEPLPYTI
jgi:hypothetical protein